MDSPDKLVKVGVNGFVHIGQLVTWAAFDSGKVEIIEHGLHVPVGFEPWQVQHYW